MKYNVVVIGSGPAGYVAAIRCAQLGMHVAVVERYADLGGTCAHVGCIPSKALLDSSWLYYQMLKTSAAHGIRCQSIDVEWKVMLQRKNEVVQNNCKGIAFLMKKNKIDVYHGWGRFQSANEIVVEQQTHASLLHTDYVIIATGSKPALLPGIPIDGKHIITSTEALSLEQVPESMIVVGGGIVGCELASVFARLGSRIHIIEYTDTILPGMDRDISTEMLKELKVLGIQFLLSHTVTQAQVQGDQVMLTVQDRQNRNIMLTAPCCLIAVGRRPYVQNLGLEHIGIELTKSGTIPVNEQLQTVVPNVYAIGDVIGGLMLAHKASEEAVFVAETLAGQKPHLSYRHIPSVVYTHPEAASVGYSEQELIEKKIPYRKGLFPFKASGRARAAADTTGFVKVLAHAHSDELLGVHIVNGRAADMIAEAVVAMEFRASAEDIARSCHAHPTFSEAIKEACLMASQNQPIHL